MFKILSLSHSVKFATQCVLYFPPHLKLRHYCITLRNLKCKTQPSWLQVLQNPLKSMFYLLNAIQIRSQGEEQWRLPWSASDLQFTVSHAWDLWDSLFSSKTMLLTERARQSPSGTTGTAFISSELCLQQPRSELSWLQHLGRNVAAGLPNESSWARSNEAAVDWWFRA